MFMPMSPIAAVPASGASNSGVGNFDVGMVAFACRHFDSDMAKARKVGQTVFVE
jgi:hypothetical protein